MSAVRQNLKNDGSARLQEEGKFHHIALLQLLSRLRTVVGESTS